MLMIAVSFGQTVYTSPLELPRINITAHARYTDYISIAWNLTDPNSLVESWRVTAEDLALQYIASYEGSANIDLTYRIATVNVHRHSTAYNICLIAYMNDMAASQFNTNTVTECDIFSTIPLLLNSSLIPLLCVLSFFLLLILIGGISYKVKELSIAHHQYKKASGAAEEQHYQNGVTKHHNSMALHSNHIEA